MTHMPPRPLYRLPNPNLPKTISGILLILRIVMQIRDLRKSEPKCRQSRVGPVAQVVEQLTFNQWVEGSNPSGLTIVYFFVDCL